ncbi:MAG: hypothetical protein HC924_10260 [Synechococcaceae cyanobacterium SM2_3_2]|nr:hypothetical protein [Synechococcaceae cyanobacterium SM2_3_2]
MNGSKDVQLCLFDVEMFSVVKPQEVEQMPAPVETESKPEAVLVLLLPFSNVA